MKKILAIIGGILGVLVAAVVVAVFVATNTDWGREKIRSVAVNAIAGSAHGFVRIGRISGNLLDGITLHDLAITDSARAPFVQIDSLHAGYGIGSLISRKIDLHDVALYGPDITLDRPPGGQWNYEKIFPTDSTAPKADTTGIQFGDWIVLHDVHLVDGNITVRTPWNPDSTLDGVQRDSAITAAVDGKTRLVVSRVDGGFQQVQRFESITGRFPLMRIAQPDFATRRFEVDSLRMRALAFAPPAAEVRQLAGAFEVTTDSIWFPSIALALPNSQATLGGRYTIDNGDLALHFVAAPLALDDARFLYPALPDSGRATFDLALDWANGEEQYLVRTLDLTTGTATLKGDIGLTLGDTLRVHETNVTFSGISTKLVEQLVPGLEVPRQGVIAGSARVDGSLAQMKVDGDVTFNDTRSGRTRVLAVGEIGSDDGVVRARNLRVTFSPLQVDLARIASPSFPLGGVLTGSAVVNGATDSRLVASRINLTHVQAGERSHFTGSGAFTSGRTTTLDINLMADPLSLVTVGRFSPSAGLRGAVAGPIRVSGPLSNLAINSTLNTSDGGVISAVGLVDVESKEIGYDLRIAPTLFNTNLLAEKAPVTSLSGLLVATGRGFDPETMRADIAADLSTSTIDTLALDSSSVRVRIASGFATVDTLFLRVPGATADASGTFGLGKAARGRFTYAVRVDSLARLARYLTLDTGLVAPRPERTAALLAQRRADSTRIAQRLAVARAAGVEPPARPVVVDSAPPVRRDSLAGTIRLQGTLVGGLSGFDTEGTASASGIVAYGNTVQRARAGFALFNVLTDTARVAATLNADSVVASGFALDSVAAQASYLKPGGTARVAVFQNSDRDYSLAANYAVFPDRSEATFNTLQLRFDSTRWQAPHPGAVRWGQPGIEIDSVEIRNAKGGRVFIDGRLPTDGPASLSLVVDRFQVADILGLLQSDVPARGLVSFDTKVSGTASAPIIAGTAAVDSAQYFGSEIPTLRTKFDYAATKLTASADATYVGRPLASATAVVPVNLALKGVTESRLLDAPAMIDVRADSVPLELAGRFTDAVSQIEGYAKGTVSVRGPLKEPKVQGDVALALGQAHLNALNLTMRRITGDLHIRGDTVVLDSLTADSDGRIAITGGVSIAKIAEPAFDLHLSAANARVLNNETGRVRADADIAVVGPFDAVRVNGRARIREGVLYIPKSDSKQMISAGDPVVFAVADTSRESTRELIPGQSPLLANLQMNLTLGVDRDTWVRSTEANVEIHTDEDLRINIDQRSQGLTLDGSVSTDRGEYEFLSKRFQIKRGTATFIGTQEINPLLQFTGEYEIKQASRQALAIRVLIGGTLLSPKLTLESDAQPPITQSDLLSYLAFGSASGSLLQFGGSSVSGGNTGGGLVGTSKALATRQLTSVALGIFVNEIEGQAARSLGADVFNITPTNVPTEIASAGGVQTFLKGTQFEFGKYLDTDTFLGLQAQLGVVPGFRAEHRFRSVPGLSLESTFQPRFFLSEPSLSEQDIKKSNAFGLFLVKRWRF